MLKHSIPKYLILEYRMLNIHYQYTFVLNINHQHDQHSLSKYSTFIKRMFIIHYQNVKHSLNIQSKYSTFIARIFNNHCQNIQHSLWECSTFIARIFNIHCQKFKSISEYYPFHLITINGKLPEVFLYPYITNKDPLLKQQLTEI